ncbi:MAG: DUF4258 domain-containing protein [Candidatus Schekmanbacteria bacterium]|nr:DUF4258 domain-containing protein [Candidatus Schekmanbacteria bacterium]
MFLLEWIQERVKKNEYYFSKHGDQERQNDNLTVTEVVAVLLNGIVLEQYADTGRGESCLVAGFTREGNPVHIVCGKRGDWLVVITTYIPQPPKFKTPYERGVK